MRPEIMIEVTDAWLSGSSETVSVPIDVLRGTPRFLITPTDEKDREAIAAANGYCLRCEGKGYEAIAFGREMRGVPCPKCKGKSASMASQEVRLAILKHVCHGWEGWATREGKLIPYSEKVVESIARNAADIYGAIVNASQELKKSYLEAEQGNSPSGPEPSSGETTHRSGHSPESSES